MQTVSVYADEELVDEFDDKVFELKTEGKIDRDASRSEVIRMLMREWTEGNSRSTSSAELALAH